MGTTVNEALLETAIAGLRKENGELRQWIELLMYRIETTRDAQREARSHKLASRQKKADELEATLDAAIRELSRRGFSTDAYKKTAAQGRLI